MISLDPATVAAQLSRYARDTREMLALLEAVSEISG